MRIVIIHHHLTTFYKVLIEMLAQQGHDVHFIGPTITKHKHAICHKYDISPSSLSYANETTQYYLRNATIIRDTLYTLKGDNIIPDIVIASARYGEYLCVKDVFAHCQLYVHAFFYDNRDDALYSHPHYHQYHREFFQDSTAYLHHNSFVSHMMTVADSVFTNTLFQKNSYPALYHDKISIIPEPLLRDIVTPNSNSYIELNKTTRLSREQRVVTFYASHCDIASGFDIFMDALPIMCARDPDMFFIIIGQNTAYYNVEPAPPHTYKDICWDKVKDECDNIERIRFIDHAPFHHFLSLLQVSACHCHMSYPFPLGRTIIDAMGVACPIVASNTSPFADYITHEKQGLLVDMYNPMALAEHILALSSNPDIGSILGANAREYAIEHHDVEKVFINKVNTLLGL